MILTAAAQATSHIQFSDLGLHSVALDLSFFKLKWYSLAYIAGILVGWWYLLKLLGQPGAPMARRHADDMVFYATIGIIVGGRLGYVIFYQPGLFLEPLKLLQLWEGGMSFHGGVIGVMLAILWLCRKEKLNWLRVHDYVACAVPFGLFFGRVANFVNGELWGHRTDVPWGIVYDMRDGTQPTGETFARHPSQLYEAGLEGLLVGLILWFLFWKTDARYQPGKLVGTFILGYGLSRWFVEFFRVHDAQFNDTIFATPGLHMGQLLTLPMIFGGIYLIATAKKRRERVEPFAGDQTVA